jgi:hypothetical protein
VRGVLGLLLLLVAMLPAGSVAARDFGRPGSFAHRAGPHRPPWGPSPVGVRDAAGRRRVESLRAFTAHRSFEAGVRLLELSRDAERRSVERRLRATASPPRVRAYRRRIEAEEALDDLRIRGAAAQQDLAWWNALGPVTRRVLDESGIAVRRMQREHELRTRLDALERDAAQREHTSRIPW